MYMSDDSVCTASLLLEVALFNTQWRRDVSLKMTCHKTKHHQNWFEWAITVNSEIYIMSLSFDVVAASDQNIDF